MRYSIMISFQRNYDNKYNFYIEHIDSDSLSHISFINYLKVSQSLIEKFSSIKFLPLDNWKFTFEDKEDEAFFQLFLLSLIHI